MTTEAKTSDPTRAEPMDTEPTSTEPTEACCAQCGLRQAAATRLLAGPMPTVAY